MATVNNNYRLSLDKLTDLNDYKGVKLLALNVRSLLSKIDMLRIELFKVAFDFLVINETWLKPNVNDGLLALHGYAFKRADRLLLNENGDYKTGGGLLIYYKIDYVCIDLPKYSSCTDDLETLCVLFTHENYERIIVLSVYRPPSGSLANAINCLSDLVVDVKGQYTDVDLFITGGC